MRTEPFKSGFVALIGRPNVGKSTLLNTIIGQKVAIMSNKPQTTRNRIQGVFTRPNSQIVFLDTPGIHKPKSRLGDYMVKSTMATLDEVDVICWVVDVTDKMGSGDQYIMNRLHKVETPIFLLCNKIDLVHPDQLLPFIDEYRKQINLAEVIPLSGLKGNNVQTLVDEIFQYLPTGPQYYPTDQVTDFPEQFIVSELVREKILHKTREEIPHSVAVVIEDMEKRPDRRGTVFIRAVILTERASQKGILIGKGGQMLKEVGEKARLDIQRLLGSPVFLDLWVKVKGDWRNEERTLRRLGYKHQD